MNKFITLSDKEYNTLIKGVLEEAKKSVSLPLDSLEGKRTLNPEIFDKNQEVHKDVKLALLRIAKDFYDSLDRDGAELVDVVMTGSLANYNWSDFSDIDLHLVFDFSQEKDPETTHELFVLKSKRYNEKHDIEVKGYEVEVYSDATNKAHHSSGVYSLKKDKWVIRPTNKFKEPVNRIRLKKKTNFFIEKIERAIKDKDADELIAIKDTIKQYRRDSLEKYGEKGLGNMVFKLLRRTGYMGRLIDKVNDIKDKELSLENEM